MTVNALSPENWGRHAPPGLGPGWVPPNHLAGGGAGVGVVPPQVPFVMPHPPGMAAPVPAPPVPTPPAAGGLPGMPGAPRLPPASQYPMTGFARGAGMGNLFGMGGGMAPPGAGPPPPSPFRNLLEHIRF